MNISTRRLSYVLKSKTQVEVSEVTGIPQSTISRVKNGQIELPSKYTSTLRNYYQREAYSDLRISGASATQAKRFSWYVPEIVTDVVSTLKDTLNMLSTAWVARESMADDIYWTEDEYLAAKEEAEKSILEAMQKSEKTIEEIYTSGKKKLWEV